MNIVMETTLLLQSPASFATPLLAVFAVNTTASADPNAKPEPALLSSNAALAAAAAKALATGEFKAGPFETLLLHSPAGLAAERLLLIGLGKPADLTLEDLRRAAGTAVRAAKPRSIKSLAIAVPESSSPTTADAALLARALTEGAFIGDFDPDTYRSDRTDQSVAAVAFLAPTTADRAALDRGLREGCILAEAQRFARILVNEPGNILPPLELARRAQAELTPLGLSVEVHSTDKLRELGMGAFLGVAQGSVNPPALIVMRYEPSTPPPAGSPVLGLVGKGITFDTGGISIKPAADMDKMKYDMAGSAAMIGAMRAIAQLKPSVRVLSVVCSAENMPDGNAYRPGDVLRSMQGKTIEVLNTDAEGRLVLADGLHYARTLGATHLIDAATLTGACVVALGMLNAGLFSNDEAACAQFQKGLAATGEKFWRLPCTPDYRELIKSSIADIINTGGRWGGAITAAMFLKEFVADTPWIHLDIAGMAWQEETKPWIAKGPSGVAVRSIVEWVRSY